MHESSPILNASSRAKLGSRYARRARTAGKLPAVVYGHGEDPASIELDAKDTIAHLHKGEKVFRLNIDGNEQMVLIKDLQFDYLGNNIIHADFARVDLNERVHAHIHVNLVGEAVGLKTAGAILMHPTEELDVECRVSDLPEKLDIDISSLEAGSSITAGQVLLPTEDMKLLSDENAVIAQIIISNVSEETSESDSMDAEASPEVLTAKKEDENKDD